MGMRDFIDKISKKTDEKLSPPALDPKAQEEKKKAAARKTAERVEKAFFLARKAMETKKAIDEKTSKISDAAADGARRLAEKARPLAEKIDTTVEKMKKKPDASGENTPSALKARIGTLTQSARGAFKAKPPQKPEAEEGPEQAQNKPPSSGLLGVFIPTPKKDTPDEPKP